MDSPEVHTQEPSIRIEQYNGDSGKIFQISNEQLNNAGVTAAAYIPERAQVYTPAVPREIDTEQLIDRLSDTHDADSPEDIVRSVEDAVDKDRRTSKEFPTERFPGDAVVVVQEGVAHIAVEQGNEDNIKLVRGGKVYEVGDDKHIKLEQQMGQRHRSGTLNLQNGDKLIIGEVSSQTLETAIDQEGDVSAQGLSRTQVERNSPSYVYGEGYMHEPSVGVVRVDGLKEEAAGEDSFEPFKREVLDNIRLDELDEEERRTLQDLLSYAEENPDVALRISDAVELYSALENNHPIDSVELNRVRSELLHRRDVVEGELEQASKKLDQVEQKIKQLEEDGKSSFGIRTLQARALGIYARALSETTDALAEEFATIRGREPLSESDVAKIRTEEDLNEEKKNVSKYTVAEIVRDLKKYEEEEFGGRSIAPPSKLANVSVGQIYELLTTVYEEPSEYGSNVLGDEELRDAVIYKFSK